MKTTTAEAQALRVARAFAGKRSQLLSRSRLASALTLLISTLGVALGCLSLGLNSLDSLPIPLLAVLSISLAGLIIEARNQFGIHDMKLVALVGLCLVSVVVLVLLPENSYGLQLNAVVHHSFFSAILLMAISVPSLCAALYYFLGATPTAEDISRYPLVILPVGFAFAAYAFLLARVVAEGLPEIDWSIVSTPFKYIHWKEQVIVNGWPQVQEHAVEQAGMRNHLLGTMLLVAMTSLISLPIGVGTGIFLSEYASRRAGDLIRFSVTALRAISVFILALTAISIVKYTSGGPLSDLFAGFYRDANGFKHVANGSFFTASILLSLLVIPVLARATEEGCRSVPTEIREGSVALGATDGYTLARLIVPWALPNILTALLLGCAEASGSVAIIMFIGGTGEYGIGPLREVTSLSFLVFDSEYGMKPMRDLMGTYQFSAALLLLVLTMGFSMAALLLKRRFARRFQGAT